MSVEKNRQTYKDSKLIIPNFRYIPKYIIIIYKKYYGSDLALYILLLYVNILFKNICFSSL